MEERLRPKPNVLLIMPKFYSYANALTKELECCGYEIKLYYEEPPAFWFLLIRRISRLLRTKVLFSLFCKSLYKKINSLDIKFDLFILIRGNIIQPNFIQKIKHKLLSNNSWSVYYTWDSLKYLEHKGKLADHFDSKYSFDSVDVNENPQWQLLPLFYTDVFNIKKIKAIPKIKYDVSCIASYNEQRYVFLKRFVKNNPELKIKILLYVDKKVYDTKVKTDSILRSVDTSWIIFKFLSPEDVVQINLSSKAMLDYTDSLQNGLSMRTIESIGLKRKLITNNIIIKEYDFYSQINVFLLDSNIKIPIEWLNTDYYLDENIREKYSLRNWTSKLLERDDQ